MMSGADYNVHGPNAMFGGVDDDDSQTLFKYTLTVTPISTAT